MIVLTPSAIDRARNLILKDDAIALHVSVRGGGCSGLNYVIETTKLITETDHVIEFGDVKVTINKRCVPYVNGMILDYESKNLTQLGFKFMNPNAKSTCGCGTSFTV